MKNFAASYPKQVKDLTHCQNANSAWQKMEEIIPGTLTFFFYWGIWCSKVSRRSNNLTPAIPTFSISSLPFFDQSSVSGRDFLRILTLMTAKWYRQLLHAKSGFIYSHRAMRIATNFILNFKSSQGSFTFMELCNSWISLFLTRALKHPHRESWFLGGCKSISNSSKSISKLYHHELQKYESDGPLWTCSACIHSLNSYTTGQKPESKESAARAWGLEVTLWFHLSAKIFAI